MTYAVIFESRSTVPAPLAHFYDCRRLDATALRPVGQGQTPDLGPAACASRNRSGRRGTLSYPAEMSYSNTMTKRRSPTADLATNPAVAGLTVQLASDVPEIDNRAPEAIDPAHRAAVEEGLAQIRRGDYATDEEVEATYRSVGL